MLRAFVRLIPVLAGAVLVAGCGEEKLHDVSGTITFEGQPIPKGQISFDPDTTKGTKGIQGFANIENGKYDTSQPGKGKGLSGGTYHIRISGFDGKEAPEAPFGKFLFPEHHTTQELPAKPQTFDYDVKKKT